jgi:hypothetical protein
MPNSKVRVIAVEEHFLTEEYLRETASLKEAPSEQAERAFHDNFPKNPEMRQKITDIATRLAEMTTYGGSAENFVCAPMQERDHR